MCICRNLEPHLHHCRCSSPAWTLPALWPSPTCPFKYSLLPLRSSTSVSRRPRAFCQPLLHFSRLPMPSLYQGCYRTRLAAVVTCCRGCGGSRTHKECARPSVGCGCLGALPPTATTTEPSALTCCPSSPRQGTQLSCCVLNKSDHAAVAAVINLLSTLEVMGVFHVSLDSELPFYQSTRLDSRLCFRSPYHLLSFR
jgi:hypothetical protein